jgi:hypothetical protein
VSGGRAERVSETAVRISLVVALAESKSGYNKQSGTLVLLIQACKSQVEKHGGDDVEGESAWKLSQCQKQHLSKRSGMESGRVWSPDY